MSGSTGRALREYFRSITGQKDFKRLLYAGALVAFLAAVFFFVLSKQAAKVRIYEFNGTGINTRQDSLVLRMTVPEDKIWKDSTNYPEKPFGAQYEFFLSNSGSRTMKDWTVRMDFNEEPEINSSWNGEFEVVGKSILFKPDKFTESFKDGDPTKFGAVLYSRKMLSLTGYGITCRLQPNLRTMPLFYIILLAGFLWLLAFLSFFLSYARIESIRYLRKRDTLVIEQSIRTFTSFIDAKDTYTRGHSVRVAIYAREIARRADMDEEEQNMLYYETLLHDVGKISIPDSILQKPGRLTPEEFEVIKTHPSKGNEMLRAFTAIPNIRDGAHYHHERYDGKGYPMGLKGADIPVHARIICVADSFDAMSSLRSYRAPFDNKRIIEELQTNSGTQFDPAYVRIMVDMINDGFTDKIRYEYGADGE